MKIVHRDDLDRHTLAVGHRRRNVGAIVPHFTKRGLKHLLALPFLVGKNIILSVTDSQLGKLVLINFAFCEIKREKFLGLRHI